MLWCSVALLALFASVQGRAVNISNTWVLPEEGFPVFYRYFRDRISWYEADAVCQFHHANLVTVDTTAQYDAVRAYLKELDISSAVWVGLIRSNPDGDFTWTDYRGLSGEGYWSSAPDARTAPLCAAADPAADYRWEARACGGPTVASFICELPVPQWALGNEGCMVRALPALTILYLPESAAVQLTADCGLAGVKRVQCTGNVKREDLLKELSCEEEITTTASIVTTSNAGISSSTIDAVFTDQDTTTDLTTEESLTTEHEDDINESMSTSSTTTQHNLYTEYKLPGKLINSNQYNRINLEKNLDLNMNNLQSNYIPKIANGDNYLTNEQLEKIEDEKHMQHKMLHEEIARLGNVENIFTQPTDHFVPPLVMAKAKLSDDMTVLSLQEKHAQQIAEQHFLKQNNRLLEQNEYDFNRYIIKTTTEGPKPTTPEKSLMPEIIKPKDNLKKDKLKTMPKKYYDPKFKIQRLDLKPISVDKIGTQFSNDPELITKASKTTPMVQTDDSTLDLTITLKDIPNDLRKEQLQFYNYTSDVSKLEVLSNNTGNNDTEIKLIDVEATEETITKDVPKKHFNEKIQNITMNHEVIKITIISEAHSTVPPTIFEVTTKIPSAQQTAIENVESMTNNTQGDKINHLNLASTHIIAHTTQPYIESELPKIISKITTNSVLKTENTESVPTTTTNETPQLTTRLTSNNNDSSQNLTEPTSMPTTETDHEIKLDYSADIHETDDTNTNSTDAIDDLNSPLLSGANEPLPRPNRSRRPQPQPIRNKFNPFRILG